MNVLSWEQIPEFNYEVYNFFFVNDVFPPLNSFFNTRLKTFINYKNINNLLPNKKNIQTTSIIKNFSYLKNSSFIDFFLNNFIDVPVCFKKSESLRLKSFELPILKFINYLMREGKKEKSTRFLFFAIRSIFKDFKSTEKLSPFSPINWLNFYFLISTFFFIAENKKKNFNFFDFDTNYEPIESKIITQEAIKKDLRDLKDVFETLNIEQIYKISYETPQKAEDNNKNEEKKEEKKIIKLNLNLDFHNLFINSGKIINISLFLKKYLTAALTSIKPLFSFYVYNVDKKIKKFSRGKSGKYIFIWKYIPSYKRQFSSFRWINKEIKLAPHSTYKERLVETLVNTIFKPDNSLAWKIKKFSYSYIFKNFRKTFLVSLKTISKK